MAAEPLGNIFMLLGSIVAWFIPPAFSVSGGILLIGNVSVFSNPRARAHEAAGDSSSKRAKDNFGKMFDTTKHYCRSPGYCVREAHVVCQSADAIKLNFRNFVGPFELMCSAGDWI